jgi:hypothetical protein
MHHDDIVTKTIIKKKKLEKKVVGLVELVTVIGKKGRVTKKALLDTGATRTSVDIRIAAKAGIGPIISSVQIKNATASAAPPVRRPIAEAKIKMKGIVIKTGVNVVDRAGLPYPILIGRDVLHKNFIVDITKTHTSHKVKDMKKITKKKVKK